MIESIIHAIDFFLSPILFLKPHLVILIIASFLTITITFLSNFFIGRKYMKELREKFAKIRSALDLAQKSGDIKKMHEILKEMLKINFEYLKVSLKLTLISISILAFFLPWLHSRFSAKTVAMLPFSIPFIGNSINWIVWYLLVSFAIAWILRKLIFE